MPRRLLVIATFLTFATSASAQPKVSGGSTAPTTGATPTPTTQDRNVEPSPATPPVNRGATARKALNAIKGGESDKGAATGRKPGEK